MIPEDVIDEIVQNTVWLSESELVRATGEAEGCQVVERWKRERRVFGVLLNGEEKFASYQFDDLHRPLAIVQRVLATFPEYGDPWTVAAWFHFPNGWLIDVSTGKPVAPKDAIQHGAQIEAAAARRTGTYVA